MAAKDFLKSLQALEAFIVHSGDPLRYARTKDALGLCKVCVEEEFILEIAGDRRGKKRTARELTLMKQVRYFRNKALRFEKMEKARKRRGQEVSKQVLVKAGLADPSINPRQMQQVLAEDEGSNISHTYIGKVRDAFAETLKSLAKDRLGKVVSAMAGSRPHAPGETLFVLQIHDEASIGCVPQSS